MARIAKSVPYSGTFPHREHRSKKGRKPYSKIGLRGIRQFKLRVEKLKLKDLE